MTRALPRYRLAAAMIALAVLISACSSSVSQVDKAKSSVTGFFRAVADDKGDQACNLLTDSAVTELDKVAFSLTAPGSCAEAVKIVNRQLDSDAKKALKSAKVNRVTITGDRATVADNDIVLKSGGTTGLFRNNDPKPLQLQKVGSDWKIASLG
ncbi:MAG: hypothetical protein ACR2HY_05570 [Acidimicrobiales bacterium]